ncbi:MAG: GWxTD domain-containing protein [Acidobacteriota bacterium]
MLTCLLLLTLVPASADYRPWLAEEVPYLISARERDSFKALHSDLERDRFIEQFWKRRDPDPSTAVNEFQEEHYRRVRHANQRFDREGKPGWKTERGRAYIIHGPPDQVSYSYGSHQKVFVRNPTDILLQSGTALPIVDIEFPTPASETWVYRSLPSSTTQRSHFTVIFAKMDPGELSQLQRVIRQVGSDDDYIRRHSRDLAIKRFISNRSYLRNDYKIVYAGEPRFLDLASFLVGVFDPLQSQHIRQFDVQLAIADLHRPSGEVLEEREARRRKMEELVEGRVYFGVLPVEVGYGFLRSFSGQVNIPLHVRIGLDEQEPPESVDLFAELVEADGGRIMAQFQDRIRPRKKGAALGGQISYQSRLGAAPGSYRLRVVASDIAHQKIGMWEEQILVPDLASAEFGASDPVFCDQVMDRGEFREGAPTKTRRDWILYSRQNPLRLDEWIFVPATDNKFRRRQNLTILLEVYNPTLKPGSHQPAVEVQALLLQRGSTVAATQVQSLEYLTGKDKDIIVYAFSIPLKNLDPGEYDFVVNITDLPTGRRVQKRSPFRIY